MLSRIVHALALSLLTGVLLHAAKVSGVVKITGGLAMGTGVCLDSPCLHVLTNYHVAAAMGRDMRVEGGRVRNARLFTGPGDAGAVEIEIENSTMRYNPAKDLALITLESALPGRFVKIPFAMYEARVGQDVVRSARFGNLDETATGKIVSNEVGHRSHAGAVTDMPKHFLLDCPSRPGNSGGVVMDSMGKAIGMVAMRSTDAAGHVGTIAISAELVSDFLKSADEALWRDVFPASHFEEEPLPVGLGAVTRDGIDGAQSVASLRARARENARAMRDVVAMESVRTWGENQAARSWLYSIAMYADGQKYQRISNGVASPEVGAAELVWPRVTGVVPGEQWSLVAPLLDDASIVREGSGVFEGRPAQVFRYRSSTTGCASRYSGKEVFAGCSGVVVTDERINALLVTQTMTLPLGHASTIRWTEKFEVLSVGGRDVLLPVDLRMCGEFRTGKKYYATAVWSGYRVFGAQSAVKFGE